METQQNLNTLANLATLLLSKTVDTKLAAIESKLDLINETRQNVIQYRQLTLNPTFEVGGSWTTEPTSLINITDVDDGTSTNVFQTGDGAWATGWVNIVPAITIPSLSRLKTKLWIANSQSLRSFSELAVLNSANEFISIWANIDPIPVTGKIINIDVIIPYTYSKVRYRIVDTTQYHPRMQIYNLNISEVFVA